MSPGDQGNVSSGVESHLSLVFGRSLREVGLAKEKPERVLPLVWDRRGPKPAVCEVPVAIRPVRFMFGDRGWVGRAALMSLLDALAARTLSFPKKMSPGEAEATSR